VLYILRVSPIEKTFKLQSAGNTEPACIAVAKVDDSRPDRDTIRHKCDQLLQDLARSMSTADAEAVTIRHQNGTAPCIYRGTEVSDLKASVAHSGPWVAVGLTRQGNIGVDIQVQDSRERFREMADFLELNADASVNEQQFFSSWALREAIAKATDDSVLAAHAREPELAAACREHGRVVNAGSLTAMVDRLSPDTHFAVVLNRSPETPACA
jgi:phosphopantetheinyl transferase